MIGLIIILLILLTFSFIFTKLSDKKLKFWKMFLIFLVYFFLISFTQEITNTKIITPFLKIIFPPHPSISFEPTYRPIIKDSISQIQINYENGEVPLNNIFVKATYLGEGGMTKEEIKLDTRKLTPNEKGVFFIKMPDGWLNCSFQVSVKGYILENKTERKCFYSLPTLYNTCILKFVNISLQSMNFDDSFSFYYPMRSEKVEFNLSDVDNNPCPLVNDNFSRENYEIHNLTLLNLYEYPPAWCEQDLLPKNNCVNTASNYSSLPKTDIFIDGIKIGEWDTPTL